jgi:asparagine synthase (glutamine-hydrolysing)
MCGFFISNNKVVTDKDEITIENLLRFRGPDSSSGLISHAGWHAYHSRLSIIDIEVGNNQPMIDEYDGMLVFNGEILNYKELSLKYFSVEYSSDTYVLSRLISNNLLDVNELDGFFSFVYIDCNGEVKHAVRDPFGVKPLFYHQDDNGISFCSEPSVLSELFKCNVDPVAVEEYKSCRAPIFSGSYFEKIESVRPGECLVDGIYFDAKDYIEKEFIDLDLQDLKSAIKKGVQTRMVSDAPVGLLLSRGVDSNLIKQIGNFEKFYSIGFKGDEDIEYLNEQNYQGLTTIECTPGEYKSAFDYLINLRKEPMSVPNEVLLYLIAKKAAKDGVKVLLSGEGADEFFAGYDRVFQWAKNTEFFELDMFLERYCYRLPSKEGRLYQSFERVFSEIKIEKPFEKVRWFFIRYHMPVLFRRLDFSLMAAGVEGREPLANMHVFLAAVKMNEHSLMAKVLGKVPLRELIAEYMGRDFAYEKKVGFPVDLTKVFENKNNISSYELWFENNLKVLGK